MTPRAVDGAHDVLDRLGGGGIEAGGRLVEKQQGRIARQRAGERQPLLLAAGQPACRTAFEPAEPDIGKQFGGALGALVPRHAGRGQRVADIAGGAAAEHRRALEQDGAAVGRRGRSPPQSFPPQVMRPRVTGISPMAARNSVVLPEPFGPIRTVGAPAAERQRNTVEDRHLAGDDGHV